ncbi:MAG: autoinducer 2 ABC transporter substrate-binding protein [Firmicutes bacterium]|jgi:simple sugar transport system substrate-binding protein|nr:autoinducer 2 ABC transporter substrate-binding protein [Bacillota bacterium]
MKRLFEHRALLSLLVCIMMVFVFGIGAFAKEYTMVCIPKLRIPWFNQMENGLHKAGADFGINVYQQAPASADEAEQVRLIGDAINQGVDAILVVPNNATSCEPVFARAQSQNIIVMTHESPDQVNADYDIEMIDNVKFGEKAIELMVEKMGPSGKFVVFVGSLTVPAHNIWADAALALAKEKYADLVQVADRYPVSEDQHLARQTSLEILTAHPDIKGFLCFGSQGAPGAAQAVREKGLQDKVAVIGTTSPNQASQFILDGSMDYSILWDPGEAAYVMVYLAKLMLEGKGDEIVDGMNIPGIGEAKIEGMNVLFDRPLIVTKDNVAEYDF